MPYALAHRGASKDASLLMNVKAMINRFLRLKSRNIDKDDRQSINKRELTRAMEISKANVHPRDVNLLLDSFDTSGNGKTEYKEFLELIDLNARSVNARSVNARSGYSDNLPGGPRWFSTLQKVQEPFRWAGERKPKPICNFKAGDNACYLRSEDAVEAMINKAVSKYMITNETDKAKLREEVSILREISRGSHFRELFWWFKDISIAAEPALKNIAEVKAEVKADRNAWCHVYPARFAGTLVGAKIERLLYHCIDTKIKGKLPNESKAIFNNEKVYEAVMGLYRNQAKKHKQEPKSAPSLIAELEGDLSHKEQDKKSFQKLMDLCSLSGIYKDRE